MSEMDYQRREGEKETERKRKVPWENYKKSKEWADQKRKILEQDKFQKESGWKN